MPPTCDHCGFMLTSCVCDQRAAQKKYAIECACQGNKDMACDDERLGKPCLVNAMKWPKMYRGYERPTTSANPAWEAMQGRESVAVAEVQSDKKMIADALQALKRWRDERDHDEQYIMDAIGILEDNSVMPDTEPEEEHIAWVFNHGDAEITVYDLHVDGDDDCDHSFTPWDISSGAEANPDDEETAVIGFIRMESHCEWCPGRVGRQSVCYLNPGGVRK